MEKVIANFIVSCGMLLLIPYLLQLTLWYGWDLHIGYWPLFFSHFVFKVSVVNATWDNK